MLRRHIRQYHLVGTTHTKHDSIHTDLTQKEHGDEFPGITVDPLRVYVYWPFLYLWFHANLLPLGL